jgi:uncharacterized OB-fold protein
MSTALSFAPASGRGVVYSYTWAHRPGGRAFVGQEPYPIVVVELAEGVRMMTSLPGVSHDDLRVDAPVELAGFEPTAEDGPPVPVFRLSR